MNKKQSKRQRDIKTKLIAAICMLLVSSIMMVSTTYAWFTLSTAPEVTGINTAVGSNGNLEMALLPLDGDVTKITSGTADSMAVSPAKVSNVTWGNLVKLDGTGENGYGLDQIVLYPSELNKTTVPTDDGKSVDQINNIVLKTPVYGADGRVSELTANTATGVYANGGFYESVADVAGTPYGVRGIGTTSSMSPRNLAYRLAMGNANTAALSAKSTASTTLNNNGSRLANIAIARALNDADEFSQEDVNTMLNVLNDLLDGSLKHIETALKNYIVAATIAPATADDNYEAVVTAITAETTTLEDLADGKITGADNAEITVVLPGDMATWIGKLNTMRTDVQNAKSQLEALTGGTYTWAQISGPMGKLVNTDKLAINGTPVKDAVDDPSTIFNDVMANGLQLIMTSGAGVFADIADFAGNYGAEILIENLKFGTLEFDKPVAAKMNTSTTANPVHLTAAARAVNEAGFGTTDVGGGNSPITDFYGFIIDLAFRTNAANSWLQIQPTAVDRIYEDGTNVNTMGHGATMTFGISDADNFPGDSVKNLMGAIRIVFFDPSAQNEIISYARLNTSAADTAVAGQITMPIMLCDATGTPKADDDTTDQRDGSVGIMELAQNQIHQLSVLVYLDGSVVGNDDIPVAANLTGSMNLQFSSSATLVAMQYADLKAGEGGALDGSGSTTETTGPAVTAITTTKNVDNGLTGVTVSDAYATTSGTAGIGFTVTGYDSAAHTVTVSIDGATAVTPTLVETKDGVTTFVVAGTTGTAVTINVTPKTT